MSTGNCGKCVFYDRHWNTCHRYPPIVESKEETYGGRTEDGFPRVSYEMWCGEFVEREDDE